MRPSSQDQPDRTDSLEQYRENGAAIAVPILRLLHLSDLHFVDHSILTKFQVKGLRGHDLNARDALINAAKKLMPDFIFVTGDQTTWGDQKSLRAVRKFLLQMLRQTRVPTSRLFCIPGNHDVLLHYYRPFSGQKRNYDLFFKPRNIIQLAEFKGYKIAIFLFDSTVRRELRTLLWPFKGSMGQVSASAFNEFNKARLGCDDLSSRFKVACVHHHPLPIPYKPEHGVNIELTTMSNGGTFIAYMQESGVNLVLHGHEHVAYSCAYRFSTEAPELIVAAAGSSCQSRCHRIEFNFIQVIPRNRTIVAEYNYSEVGFRPSKDGTKVWTHPIG